jgi:hypothetical protein
MHPSELVLGVFLVVSNFAIGSSLPSTSLLDDAVLRERLVGVWALEFNIGVFSVTSYAQMNADGTYVSVGKSRMLGTTKPVYEEGTWTVEQGVCRTSALLTLDPAAPPSSISKIAELDAQKWVVLVRDGKKTKRAERTKIVEIPPEFSEGMQTLRKDLRKPNPSTSTARDGK